MELETKQFAVVTVEGSWLVLCRALCVTREEAESRKSEFPNDFGTFVYPVREGSVKVGLDLKRNRAYESAA